jgi:hypothetical protein
MANNQLSARELEELKKLYRDIDSYTQSQAEAAALNAQNIGVARGELERLRREYAKLASDVSNALDIFHQITQEISKQNLGINESKKGYRGLTSIAEKIQQYQQGITNLSSKEVEKLKDKVKQEQLRLKNTQNLLNLNRQEQETLKARNEAIQTSLENQIRQAQQQGAFTGYLDRRLQVIKDRHKSIEKELQNINTAYTNNQAIIEENDEGIKGLNRSLEVTEKEVKDIEKAMGLAGAALKGVNKIPILKDLPGMSDVLGEVEEKIKRINKEREAEGKAPLNRAQALGVTFKSMGPVIKNALTDPLVLGGFLLKGIIDIFKSIDEGAGKLAKSMDMSYSGALGLRQQLSSIATSSNDVAVNTKGLQESYMAIGQALGANADINKEDLITFTKLREQAGFTNEELTAMYKMSLVTGKSVEQTSEEFLGGAEALAAQKGLAINVKQLMKETLNASAAMKLSIGGGAKGLAEAAIQAKALGVTLDQVDKIAGSLLQFEDSITAELEAELLTGKQINLERARLAALNGDIATVAEEINNQIGGSAEFSKMNRIQQEAFAKAVGMSREELAASLVEQEALQKVGAKTAEEAKAKYEEYRKTMTAEEAAAKLGDDALARQYEQQSVQERFNQAVEKLKDIFVSIADGPISSILNAFATILSNSTAIKVIIGALGGLAGLWAFSMIQGAIAAIASASALTLGLGALAIAAGIGTAVYAMNSASNSAESSAAQVKDGAMGLDPNGGPVVSSFQQGELKPVMQGIKQDKAYLTTNKPTTASSAPASSPQTIVIHTHVMLNEKEIATAVNETNLTNTVKPQ